MPPQFMYGFIYGVLLIISGLMFPRSYLVLLQTRKQTEYSALDITPVCMSNAFTDGCEPNTMFDLYQIYQC